MKVAQSRGVVGVTMAVRWQCTAILNTTTQGKGAPARRDLGVCRAQTKKELQKKELKETEPPKNRETDFKKTETRSWQAGGSSTHTMGKPVCSAPSRATPRAP